MISREKIVPLKGLCEQPQNVGEILNKYLSTVFAVENVMKAMELKEMNSDVLEHN